MSIYLICVSPNLSTLYWQKCTVSVSTKYKMVGLGKRSEYCELPLTEYHLFTENKNWPKRTPRGCFIFSGFQVQVYSSGNLKHRVSIFSWFNFPMGVIYNPCISRISEERKRGEGGGMGLSRFSSESSQNQICPKENTFSSSFYWICCGFYLPCISGCIRGREKESRDTIKEHKQEQETG